MGLAGPLSICRRPCNTGTHTHTLTPDLCIYALQRHGSKEYGWRGLGRVERGRRLFGLQTETDGVLGGGGVVRWSIGDRSDSRAGGIWRAMMLIHKFLILGLD